MSAPSSPTPTAPTLPTKTETPTSDNPLHDDLAPNRRANPLYGQFERARARIKLVTVGGLVVAGVGGPPGLGKTYTAIKVLQASGYTPWDEASGLPPTAKQYLVFRGTRQLLIYYAYVFRNGGVIVLDDADSLFLEGGRGSANTMKELLDREPVRGVSNQTQRAMLNAADPNGTTTIAPPQFLTKVRFIVCSNEDFDVASTKMRPHVDALLDRGLRPVSLSTNRADHYRYVLDLIYDDDLLQRYRVKGDGRLLSLRACQDIADWFCERALFQRSVSVRRLEMVADYRALIPDVWLSHAEEESLEKRDPPEHACFTVSPRPLQPLHKRAGYVAPPPNARTLERRRMRQYRAEASQSPAEPENPAPPQPRPEPPQHAAEAESNVIPMWVSIARWPTEALICRIDRWHVIGQVTKTHIGTTSVNNHVDVLAHPGDVLEVQDGGPGGIGSYLILTSDGSVVDTSRQDAHEHWLDCHVREPRPAPFFAPAPKVKPKRAPKTKPSTDGSMTTTAIASALFKLGALDASSRFLPKTSKAAPKPKKGKPTVEG